MECESAILFNFVRFCVNKSILSTPEGHGIQEVSGSIPLISTKKLRNLRILELFSFILCAEKFCFSPLGFEGRNFLTQKLPNLDPNNNGIV